MCNLFALGILGPTSGASPEGGGNKCVYGSQDTHRTLLSLAQNDDMEPSFKIKGRGQVNCQLAG